MLIIKSWNLVKFTNFPNQALIYTCFDVFLHVKFSSNLGKSTLNGITRTTYQFIDQLNNGSTDLISLD